MLQKILLIKPVAGKMKWSLKIQGRYHDIYLFKVKMLTVNQIIVSSENTERDKRYRASTKKINMKITKFEINMNIIMWSNLVCVSGFFPVNFGASILSVGLTSQIVSRLYCFGCSDETR